MISIKFTKFVILSRKTYLYSHVNSMQINNNNNNNNNSNTALRFYDA